MAKKMDPQAYEALRATMDTLAQRYPRATRRCHRAGGRRSWIVYLSCGDRSGAPTATATRDIQANGPQVHCRIHSHSRDCR
jgi:hypothetical protein